MVHDKDTLTPSMKYWSLGVEVRMWCFLQQIEGTGSRKHKDSKIKEFHEKIEQLEHEHRRQVTQPAYWHE